MQRILISISSIIFSLLIIEVLLRVFYRPQLAWSDRPSFYYQHELSPTLQDYPYQSKKPENTFRIAVVGDSFSFAPYMQFTDAFPKKLAQLLNLNAEQRRVEVINYGVPAYSSTHEVAKVEQALKEEADLLILQITLNDPEIKGAAPIGITNFSNFAQYEPSDKMRKILSLWRGLAFVVERLHNTRTEKAYIQYFHDLFDNKRAYKAFSQAISDMAQLCKSREIPIVAVVFPLFGLPMDETYPFHAIHHKVSELLSALELPHYDISEIYKDIPLERLQVIPGVDRHPNEIAHRMAAEAIYTWLIDKNFLPQEFVIKKRYKKRTQIIKEVPL